MTVTVANEIARQLLNAPNPNAKDVLEGLKTWGEAVFGPVTPERIVARAMEEMVELGGAVEGRTEWTEKALEEAADVVVILTRTPGLWEAIVRKMNINFDRQWNLRGDGTGYHIPKETTVQKGSTMENKFNLRIGGIYQDNLGDRVELKSRYPQTFEGGEIFADSDGKLWRGDGVMIHLKGGNELVKNPHVCLMTEVLANGDLVLLGPDQRQDAVDRYINFQALKNYLTTADLLNLTEYITKIETLANRVGLEAKVELHPMQSRS